MSELILIVTIAGRRVALRTLEVQSLIELDTLAPVFRAAPHVAGLSALRSRMLTVIDCKVSLGQACESSPRPHQEAVVVEYAGHFYALLVDDVDDVTRSLSDLKAVDADLGNGWKQASKGMIETRDGPLLLLDIASLIEGPPIARAA
jgi:purine-binding chemotaxis protein CheW